MKFRFLFLAASVAVSGLYLPVKGEPLRKIYIRSFTTNSDSAENKQLASDIKDYMAEAMTDTMSLVTDDEIKEYLSNREIASSISSDQEDTAAKLLKIIDVNYLIYGKLSVNSGVYTIEATILEFRKDSGVTKKNFGEIRFSNPIYADRASRSLGLYLLADRKSVERGGLFGTRDPRKDFDKEVGKVESDLLRIEQDYQDGSASIKASSARRDKSLSSSPVIRAGVGGKGSIQFADRRMRKLYEPGQGAMVDLFLYRYKDPVGDGIDMYVRGTARQYEMKKTAPIGTASPTQTKDYIGLYEGIPDKPAKLTQYSGDFGLRFVGSGYFLGAWSIYMNGAIRYNRLIEKYTIKQKSYTKSYSGWGGVGGAGLELSLIPNMGIFIEGDYGYCQVGKNEKNIEGFQAFAGLTIRTNHWNF